MRHINTILIANKALLSISLIPNKYLLNANSSIESLEILFLDRM